MKLATDLNDLIGRYGHAMASAADKYLTPYCIPGQARVPDLSAVERNRRRLTRKNFSFFPSQMEKITATLEGLKRYGRAWLIAEMGCGKSLMSLGIAWALSESRRNRKFNVLVLCPGHIVRKWRREVEWAIPGVQVRIIRNFSDLLAWREEARRHPSLSVAIISKETAKLGDDVDKPSAASRKALQTAAESVPGGPTTVTRQIFNAAACPRCGTIQTVGRADTENPLSYEQYLESSTPRHCQSCGDLLSTAARGFRNGPHLDRYIQRKMKGTFDLLIADEVHELAGPDTIQGATFGTLAASCRYTLALTGTLIGGHARDLHAPLWRMSPELLRRRGFDLNSLRGGAVGAIGRNARRFLTRYGVLEHQVIRSAADDYSGAVRRGAAGRKREYKTAEMPRPGISPDLYNHFLIGRAVFMSLGELGPALPPIERILEPCTMSEELRDAYSKIDREILQKIKDKAHSGKGPPVLATIRVQALDAYADKPWGWSPITCPAYNEAGKRTGSEFVTQPTDLGENRIDNKDERLVKICTEEQQKNRRCCVYVNFTGKHDVRPKLQQALQDAGLRAVIMPDTVQPAAREDWIESHLNELDVLIVHPRRVMTGLDLIAFPSLIFYQVGYSTHVLRQASARARRPTQTQACKVFFLYYQNSIQETALALMGEKEAASQALEGVFDTNALRAMMNGAENDDIVAALANSLESECTRDAKTAWQSTHSATTNAPLPRNPLTSGLLKAVRGLKRPVKIPARQPVTLFD
jgi:hypothetical protein